LGIWDTFWSLVRWEHAFSSFFFLFLTMSVLNVGLAILFRSRKIQPKGFKWKTYRNEFVFGFLNVLLSGVFIGGLTAFLASHGWAKVDNSQAPWWMIAGELVLYFFVFDTWFYWFHRLMHKEPIYTWVHKIHHKSTSPNLATTFSVSPLESLVNGGFVPIFTGLVTVHSQSVFLMTAIAGGMGLYVHCGYEFMPRWWNRSWATKWFITTTFHDQHHKYFNWNFGGFTTIWDRVCGTVRRKFESDFESARDRAKRRAPLPGLVPDDAVEAEMRPV
jgi:sterol desaturase/sphingolipid hydroxylase (fatty acid hydroxylase superfamily)